MARYTQELSVIFFILICVAVVAMIAYFIFSLMKKRKIPPNRCCGLCDRCRNPGDPNCRSSAGRK